MTLLAEWRARRIRPSIGQHAAATNTIKADPDRWQLQYFNKAWLESLHQSPWARALREKLDLPEHFADWEEFRKLVPVQRKVDIAAITATVPVDFSSFVAWRATGGTTAEPIRVPVFANEARTAELDHWLGRMTMGIDPADRLFLLWGHAHMFGTGLRGVANRFKRSLADWALGYTRWSAYHLSDEELQLAGDALIQSRARYVIGYSSALDRFARTNAGRGNKFQALGLKAVIATAEGFAQSDSRARIQACFGCPVLMEYGSVETGPLAYEMLGGGYEVFSAHNRLECLSHSIHSNRREITVTSLTPRAMPLLRYAVGDLIETSQSEHSITSFTRVIGRSNDAVSTPSGGTIHSEVFTHIMRDLPGVAAYQVVRGESGIVHLLRYEAEAAMASAILEELRRRLALIDPDLPKIKVVRVEHIERSVAGKSLMVVTEADD